MTDQDVNQALESATVLRAPPILQNCPVKALGHADGTYYLMDAVGQIRAVRQRGFTPAGVLDLFLGDMTWLTTHCRIEGRNVRADGKYPWDNPGATSLLMRACRAAGFFDPVENVRGPGVWPLGGEDGGLIVHLGTDLLKIRHRHGRVVREWLRLPLDLPDDGGGMVDGFAYAAARAEPAPDNEAAEAADGARLVNLLKGWNWTRPQLDPVLAAGWMVLAELAGAVPYRPTLWLVGETASGKSHVLRASAALHGSRDWLWEDITAAKVRGLCGRSARAILVDEIELKEDNRRAQDIIEMARFVYERGQGHYGRAGAEGHHGRMDAIFALASVEPPPVTPADANRHCVLQLRALTASHDRRELERHMEWLTARAAALRARILHRFVAFGPALRAIVDAFARRGLSGRTADTYSPLLAGYWILTRDTAPDEAAADDMVGRVYDSLAAAIGEQQTTGEACWGWLVTRSVEFYNHDQRRTLGWMLQFAVHEHPDTYNEGLGTHGLQVVDRDLKDGQGLRRWIFVAGNSHAGLREVFRGTRWQGGGWSDPLRRLAGAVPTPYAVKFGGARHRGTFIPATLHVDPPDQPRFKDQEGAQAPAERMEPL